jgi:hypothetical protein
LKKQTKNLFKRISSSFDIGINGISDLAATKTCS